MAETELIDVSTDQLISEKNEIISVSCGKYHTLFLSRRGLVYACGGNDFGQLGQGHREKVDGVTTVFGVKDIAKVVATDRSSLLLSKNGELYRFGRNSIGEIGFRSDNGKITSNEMPMIFRMNEKIKDIKSFGTNTVLLSKNGEVFTLGLFSKISGNAEKITGLPKIVKIAAGKEHILMLDLNGNVWGFGRNYNNEITVYEIDYLKVPTKLNLYDIVDVLAGDGASYAISENGDVFAWGVSTFGQVGNPTSRNNGVIAKIASNVVSGSTSDIQAYFVDIEGNVLEFGKTFRGKFKNSYERDEEEDNDEEKNEEELEENKKKLKDVKEVYAGWNHLFYKKADNTIVGIGENKSGQLGSEDASVQEVHYFSSRDFYTDLMPAHTKKEPK